MATVQFFPVDATYKVVNGKPQIYLFGRTPEGKQVCVIDANVEQYFYAIPKPGEDPTAALLALHAEQHGEQYSITRVEPVQRTFFEQPVSALKVFTNIPKAVAALKDDARHAPGVQSTHECDIPFTRRYFMDKGITPLTLVEAEGAAAQESLRIPVIRATTVKQASDTTLAKPRMLTFDIETYNPEGKNVQAEKHPVLMIALAGDNLRKVLTWKKIPNADAEVEYLPSEADMLDRFVELVNDYAPDIIAGYYSDGFDFPYLDARAQKCGIKLALGLDGSMLKIDGKSQTLAKIAGVAHVDILRVIRRFFAKTMETDVFTLDAVGKELLGKGKHAVDIEKLASAWDACDAQLLNEFARYNLQDAALTHELAQFVMPSLIEFVKIVGQPPYDVNRMSFSQLVEWYVMRQATSRGELFPNKPGFRTQTQRQRDRVKGAFVYEPKPGLYEDMAVCDYRSLYPSIIASLNISPGVRNCACCPDAKKIETDRGTFWYCAKRKGFVSGIIEELITRRAVIKEQLKKNKDDALLRARSQALKDLANSFYGYLGFSVARWYSIECAESTTAWGREYIKQVIARAQADGFNVIYSDTDSVFLTLNGKKQGEAKQFVERVNKDLPGLMELDFEGFYPAGIFVSVKSSEAGAKKKYALLNPQGKLKIVGFETVRRNWSPIARKVQKRVLEILLTERKPESALQYVRGVVEGLNKNKVPLADVVIRTQLSRDLSEYANAGPHVAAAQRMQELGQQVGTGTRIQYVVTKGKGRIKDKVKLPEETTQQDYDADYYVNNQILPGVEKLFEVFGIDIHAQFAEKAQSSLSTFF
jgi:DNA polymerase elongation subunit (family B)